MNNLSRPPIQTPMLDGQQLTHPWTKFFQEVQERANRSGVFIEDKVSNLGHYKPTQYAPGTEFYATDTGKFFVLTSKNGWVQR